MVIHRKPRLIIRLSRLQKRELYRAAFRETFVTFRWLAIVVHGGSILLIAATELINMLSAIEWRESTRLVITFTLLAFWLPFDHVCRKRYNLRLKELASKQNQICVECHYDLRASPSQPCPECGHVPASP